MSGPVMAESADHHPEGFVAGTGAAALASRPYPAHPSSFVTPNSTSGANPALICSPGHRGAPHCIATGGRCAVHVERSVIHVDCPVVGDTSIHGDARPAAQIRAKGGVRDFHQKQHIRRGGRGYS